METVRNNSIKYQHLAFARPKYCNNSSTTTILIILNCLPCNYLLRISDNQKGNNFVRNVLFLMFSLHQILVIRSNFRGNLHSVSQKMGLFPKLHYDRWRVSRMNISESNTLKRQSAHSLKQGCFCPFILLWHFSRNLDSERKWKR